MSQSTAKEVPCPDCGEMVRVNSLRCWNCGAFMDASVEEKFLAMQAKPAAPIHSQVPDSEMSASAGNNDDDEDFKLNLPVGNSEPESSAEPEGDVPSSSSEKVSSPSAASAASSEKETSHSVATAGDALLDIAMQEEREVKRRQKGRKFTGPVKTAGGGLIIYCPYGCKVEVKEQHRGMTGKCPRCGAPFIVPVDPPRYKKSQAESPTAGSSESSTKFKTWLTDLHLHIVEPEKLKLKADSLLKDFVEVDVGFSSENLVVSILSKKSGGGGLFSKGGGDKKSTVREAMLSHIDSDLPLSDLPVEEKYIFTAEEVSQIRVIQPTANRAASLFHGIPVFGVGRIAIQLPFTDKVPNPLYLSMGITEFWKFVEALESVFGISGLGTEEAIPMEPKTSVAKCHFSDMLVKSLENVELYQADPTVELHVIGYQCGACKTVVCEAARKKENLGGKSAKGIAKAKCPKCGSKMGEHPLYALKQEDAEPSMSESN